MHLQYLRIDNGAIDENLAKCPASLFDHRMNMCIRAVGHAWARMNAEAPAT